MGSISGCSLAGPGFSDLAFSTLLPKSGWTAPIVALLTLSLLITAPVCAQEPDLGSGILSGPPPNLPKQQAPAVPESVPAGPMDRPSTVPYRIGIGDVLAVNVWREPEVSQPGLQVRLDGKITLPLVKEVMCVGLTPTELEVELQRQFSEFLQAPEVTVIPTQIHSIVITVTGGVASPGEIQMGRPMTFLQAIAQAGGPVAFAKTKKIFIKRLVDGKEQRIPVDYIGLMKGEEGVEDQQLVPGDVIVVPM